MLSFKSETCSCLLSQWGTRDTLLVHTQLNLFVPHSVLLHSLTHSLYLLTSLAHTTLTLPPLLNSYYKGSKQPLTVHSLTPTHIQLNLIHLFTHFTSAHSLHLLTYPLTLVPMLFNSYLFLIQFFYIQMCISKSNICIGKKRGGTVNEKVAKHPKHGNKFLNQQIAKYTQKHHSLTPKPSQDSLCQYLIFLCERVDIGFQTRVVTSQCWKKSLPLLSC